jgi:DNA-binding GntR family transcriptional regulator
MAAEPRVRSSGPAPSNVVVVAGALRDALVSGRFRPGERIKEIPLARQLGVSRGPIRDALRLLERDGLVEILPNRGALVPEVRATDFLEVYALRAAIGSLALRKLLLDPLPTAAPALARSRAALERAVERGQERQAADADLAFQSALVDGSGLKRVAREFDRLTWQVRQFIAVLDVRYEGRLTEMRDDVAALHDAIVAGDGANVELLWRAKLERWVRDFVERLGDEDFDAQLWVALTSGRRPGARR